MTYDIDASLVMYVAGGVFMLAGLVLMGFAIDGADTVFARYARFVAVVTVVSAVLTFLAALAVIFQ